MEVLGAFITAVAIAGLLIVCIAFIYTTIMILWELHNIFKK